MRSLAKVAERCRTVTRTNIQGRSQKIVPNLLMTPQFVEL